jgi:Tol biopolymer transport system component
VTGEVFRLTSDPGADWDPAFTRDGKSMVWSSDRSGNFEIWIANVDGSSARQLTKDGYDAQNPVASGDGWILYVSHDPSKRGVWKIRSDGSDADRLVADDVLFAEVSPDGRYVAFLTNWRLRNPTVRVVRRDDRVRVPFEIRIEVREPGVGYPGRFRWLPDGKGIAFLGQDPYGVNGVYVQSFVPDVDTAGTARPLAGFDRRSVTESFDISPDGSRITIAALQELSSLMVAEQVPGVLPARRRAR